MPPNASALFKYFRSTIDSDAAAAALTLAAVLAETPAQAKNALLNDNFCARRPHIGRLAMRRRRRGA
jgi:hypothetical protein